MANAMKFSFYRKSGLIFCPVRDKMLVERSDPFNSTEEGKFLFFGVPLGTQHQQTLLTLRTYGTLTVLESILYQHFVPNGTLF